MGAATVEPYGIYKLPNGWEVAAVPDKDGRLFLYRLEDFSEDSPPRLFFDPLIGGVRYVGEDDQDTEYIHDPYKWTLIYSQRELEDTGRQIVTCDVCGIPVWEPESTPDILDDNEWATLAQQHKEDCEWIATKAYKV